MRRFSGRLREVVVFVNQTIAGTGSLFRKEVWVHVRFKKEFIPCHFSLSMYVRSSMKVLSGCLPDVEKTKKNKTRTTTIEM